MSRRIERCLNIADLRAEAKRRAHQMVFDYIDGGADDERTLCRNSGSFDDYDLHYRVLTGADDIDLTTTLLGQKLAVPFIASPAAGHRLFHNDGERGTAKAAEEIGTVFGLSTLSSVSIEEISALSQGPKWFQLYVWKDRGLVREMLARAHESGFDALVLTVDVPIAGNRERDPRNGFTIPPQLGIRQIAQAMAAPAWCFDYLTKPPVKYANLSDDTPAVSLQSFVKDLFDASFGWADAEWLLSEWNGPSVIKGVVRVDDARRAVDTGFDAVMVSNHGGRQLDRAPSPIEVLEPIVDAIGGRSEVILDGGVRRGTDILIALAMGANAVGIARPYLYGLAAGGAAGALRAMRILEAELRRDMTLLGAESITEVDVSLVSRRH